MNRICRTHLDVLYRFDLNSLSVTMNETSALSSSEVSVTCGCYST